MKLIFKAIILTACISFLLTVCFSPLSAQTPTSPPSPSPSPRTPSIVCVSGTTGSDATGDGSQANPWATIQHAIDTVTGTEATPVEIRVAAGTYAENVLMDDYESLYGGYDPYDWSRDIRANETIVDGSGGGANSRSVTGASNASIDGFSITGGGAAWNPGVACGIYCEETDTEVSNCTFRQNGNGIVCHVFSRYPPVYPTISNCTFRDNDVGLREYNEVGPGDLTVSGSTFENNGKGIDVSWVVTVSGSTFSQNIGSAIVGHSAIVTDSDILDNGGYGVDAEQGADLTRCTVKNNGGGIRLGYEQHSTIERCFIVGNGTGLSTGFDSVLHLNNSYIAANGDVGVKASTYTARARVKNCTIVGHSLYGILGNTATPSEATNCILWNYGDDLENCTATYSNIKDGDPGTGNISADPLIHGADPHRPDDDDFRLSVHSPCVDAGTDTGLTEDFEGDPRPVDGNVSGTAEYDMGADEYSPDIYYVSVSTGSDVTGDGSQGNPWASIGHTLSEIGYDQSSPVDIRVAAGTYTENFGVRGYLNFYGGYDPIKWGRDILANETRITGAGSYPYSCIISLDGGPVLDGFTVDGIDRSICGILVSGVDGPGGLARVSNCLITGTDDGVKCFSCGQARVFNCRFVGNNRGIVKGVEASIDVSHCTIVDNALYGIYGSYIFPTAGIINCILWNNGDDLCNATATYSDISDGDPGTGNISVDPLFLDPANDDYHLTFGSPCIDAGIGTGLTEDCAGNPRPVDGDFNGVAEYDMGAYEYMPRSIVQGGDYNGDGTADIAVFRPSTGLWAVRGLERVYFGSQGDLPVSDDYDGDGTTDIGIFRPGLGLWGVRGVTRVYYGSASDVPDPADYNGDGSADITIFRPSTGLWGVAGVTRVYFGSSGDVSAPGDYDGDGTEDIAIFRPSSGLWSVRGWARFYFGAGGDIPVPADYYGSGLTTAAIYRPSQGLWASAEGHRIYFGGRNDQPVPADYDGDLRDDIGIFRPTSGLWEIRDITRVYFGGPGDIPVTR